MKTYLRQSLAALRVFIVLSVVLGVVYPLVTLAVAQLPGLHDKADGSLVHRDGKVVGSSLIGQSFTDAKGNPLRQYFQSRPSAAGDGYDPTSSGASNLGPESVEDAPDSPSLLTQVCQRSLAVGRLEGVDGSRPYCTPSGVGAALRVFPAAGTPRYAVSVNEPCPAAPFIRTWHGVAVRCLAAGTELASGRSVVVRGSAPRHPAVPADAVTASGSGLDPDISPAYAALQVPRIAAVRGIPASQVRALVADSTHSRFAGFVGEPRVNVLALNLALDRTHPVPR